MKKTDFTPKEYKELVASLLEEDHEISVVNGLPNTFYRSAEGVEVLSNFESVFNSFVQEFPGSHMMSNEHLRFTFKILLQQQLDSYWYSGFKSYKTNLEIYNDDDLVNLNEMDTTFMFQPLKEGRRGISFFRRVYLKLINSPLKNSSGLFLPYAPYPMYNFLNSFYDRLGFRVVVNGVIRSIEYQNNLIKKGFISCNASSHIYGYTVDLEQKWFRKYAPKKYKRIQVLLDELEERGEINYIDYGHIWHVCLSPAALNRYLD